MKTILFIDTAFKIAGGQRSLFLILKNLDRKKYKPIAVVPEKSNLIKRVYIQI